MRTVIFDMDGVIVESEDFHCDAWVQAYKTIGIEIDHNFYFSRICGKHGLQSTRETLEHFGRPEKDDQQFREMLILKKDHLAADMMRGKIPPRPGVLALIRKIAQSPRKIGLGSTTSMIGVNAVLHTLNIEDQFNVMIGGEGVKSGKPHPEVYLKIAQLLEEEPHNCIVIEDSKSGINAAKSAGMKCIAVLNERNKAEDLQHADMVIGSYAEVTDEVIDTL